MREDENDSKLFHISRIYLNFYKNHFFVLISYFALLVIEEKMKKKKYILPVGELNPGLPRDRRGYLPLYYRGLDINQHTVMV